MERTFRVSVRELVAFSFFSPDILPSADTEALLTGTQAHKARQSVFDGETEQIIKHVYQIQDTELLVFGRMDAYVDGEEPFVEEIKHCKATPEEVRPEHRAQALCYAAMLAEEKKCAHVRFSVCYVNLSGEVLRSFEERLCASELKEQMDEMLLPYAHFVIRESEHRAKRNQSLDNLPFPFDSYRKGQRELAVQVYTAIARKKRLFASLPTGTGKSAAVLYPALKAMGEKKTERVVYLTARNTARQSPLNALVRMIDQGMIARCSVLTAKEKLCPAPARCHPDDCSRAKGHFLRQGEAIDDLLSKECRLWDEDVIREQADRYNLCPFEFALALSELADVLLMDLNYAFDPFAQVKRLFQRQKNFTLLVDEAHHTVDRVRESLSGSLDSREFARIRTEYGKIYGRKTSVYRILGELVHALRDMPCEQDEAQLDCVPEELCSCVQKTLDAAIEALPNAGMSEVIRICLPFLYAFEHLDEDYAILLERKGKERVLTLYCLLPGKEIAKVTKNLRGTIFFSATLSPLPAMKQLLGGTEEDACFALPSPFPKEHLQIVRKRIGTRYVQRDATAADIAESIAELVRVHPGNTIAFFPSYAYLNLIRQELEKIDLPRMWIQSREMGEKDRLGFLQAFEESEEPLLGLCVLGGLFSEGIDLPGEKLVNAVIVGVGLPVPSARINAVRACYQNHFGDGFAYACRIPGMQKVQQAAGRVIRSENDKGIVLLLDDRYYDAEYEALLPSEWIVWNENIHQAAKALEG